MSIQLMLRQLSDNSIKSLNLSKNHVNKNDAEKLNAAIAKNTSLEKITFRSEYIEEESLRTIIKTLLQHPKLRKIKFKAPSADKKYNILKNSFSRLTNNTVQLVLKTGNHPSRLLDLFTEVFCKKKNSNMQVEPTQTVSLTDEKPFSFPKLPDDIIGYIIKFLNNRELLKLANTSKKWALRASHEYHLRKGHTDISNTIKILVNHNCTPKDIYLLFRNTLIKDGYLPDPRVKINTKITELLEQREYDQAHACSYNVYTTQYYMSPFGPGPGFIPSSFIYRSTSNPNSQIKKCYKQLRDMEIKYNGLTKTTYDTSNLKK